MADEKEIHEEFSTCFEKLPFAEMMHKMMGLRGAGSLCTEMMKTIVRNPKAISNCNCAELIQKIIKESGNRQQSRNTKEEVCHGRDE